MLVVKTDGRHKGIYNERRWGTLIDEERRKLNALIVGCERNLGDRFSLKPREICF